MRRFTEFFPSKLVEQIASVDGLVAVRQAGSFFVVVLCKLLMSWALGQFAGSGRRPRQPSRPRMVPSPVNFFA
jgi:hypothetical protein